MTGACLFCHAREWVADLASKRIHVMSRPVDGDCTERHLVEFGQLLAVPAIGRAIVIA